MKYLQEPALSQAEVRPRWFGELQKIPGYQWNSSSYKPGLSHYKQRKLGHLLKLVFLAWKYSDEPVNVLEVMASEKSLESIEENG